MRTKNEARAALGARAEALVCDLLNERGFEIVARNVRVGRKEIDIVARRGDLLVFCEVRSRSRSGFVAPLETIGPAKVRNVRAAARRWLRERQLRGVAVRFDAASVLFDDPRGVIEYVEGAF